MPSESGVGFFKPLGFARGEGGLDLGHQPRDGFARWGIDGVAELIEGRADGGEHLFGFEPSLGEDALVHVFEGVLDALRDHLLDGLIGDIDGALDAEDFLEAGFYIARKDVEDAVGIDLELDANARLALGRGLEGELEAAELPIVPGHLALALEDADEHGGLAGHGVGEHLAGFGGDGGVARNDDVHQPSKGLDTQREGGDIEEDHVLNGAGEDAGLNGGAESYGLVGVL